MNRRSFAAFGLAAVGGIFVPQFGRWFQRVNERPAAFTDGVYSDTAIPNEYGPGLLAVGDYVALVRSDGIRQATMSRIVSLRPLVIAPNYRDLQPNDHILMAHIRQAGTP